MPRVTGLRSPHARVGRIVIFGRMLDKIRLNARGVLPPVYVANIGGAKPTFFDGRCCRFLGLPHAALSARTLEGGCDEEILAWAQARGAARSDEECVIWNRFVTKLGWRDDRSDTLAERIAEHGPGAAQVQTLFEYIDVDEGRPAGATRSWEAPPVSIIVVMGVSGCGKTTVGRALAGALGWEFLEADALHPAANIAKMSAGIPLDDADRAPWLESVRAAMESAVARGARIVVACSALKESYRQALTPDPAHARYALLRGDFALFTGRLEDRKGHFMKETLLSSQFEALEAPLYALALDAALPVDVLTSWIRETFGLP